MRENDNNSFNKSDYENAQLAFSLWQSKQQETIDEYLMRKRKIELNCLVRQVIENELSAIDKTIVQLHWYRGKTVNETAEAIGIDSIPAKLRHSRFEKEGDLILTDEMKQVLLRAANYSLEHPFSMPEKS